MLYNWECCSFYPNNFGASALIIAEQLSSTGLWTCPRASGNMYTGQWTCFHRPVDANSSAISHGFDTMNIKARFALFFNINVPLIDH